MWLYKPIIELDDDDKDETVAWVVGFYTDHFHDIEEFESEAEAARRVNYLNGGDGGMF